MSIEMIIVMPIVLALTFLTAQVCVWYWAREVAQTAAREGVTSGRTYKTPLSAGTARAGQVAREVGGNSLYRAHASSSGSTNDRIVITVTGYAPSLIPGLPGIYITQSASGPRENWARP